VLHPAEIYREFLTVPHRTEKHYNSVNLRKKAPTKISLKNGIIEVIFRNKKNKN